MIQWRNSSLSFWPAQASSGRPYLRSLLIPVWPHLRQAIANDSRRASHLRHQLSRPDTPLPMSALPIEARPARPARPSTQWIEPASKIQPARAADAAAEWPSVRQINPRPSAPDEYIDTNTPSCPATPQYEGPPPFEPWSEGHGGEITGHARRSQGTLCPLPEEELPEEQECGGGGRGSSNKTLQFRFSRSWAALLDYITRKKNAIKEHIKWEDDEMHLAEHTELFALVCCQFGMLFSVGEAAGAYYLQDQGGYTNPVNSTDYHPNKTAHLGDLEWQKLRSARWSPEYRMKSPAATGANICYIACGMAIVCLPNCSGRTIPDVFMLLAVNMIFLGLASFVFHYDGEVLNDWSHRADLTFILVVVGALPYLAINGLWQAYNGKESPPRDLVALITKGCALGIGGYSFVFTEFFYSEEYLVSMGVATVTFNFLSTVLMTRRAVAQTEKRTCVHRWLRGYRPREWPREWPVNCDVEVDVDLDDNGPGGLDEIDWNTWEWRKADCCTNSECSNNTMWPSHETWGAIELALPRFLLNMAIIWIGQQVNARSDVIRNEGWGDKNVTAQWYVDQEKYHSQGDGYIDTAIERRKVYDFLHGSWQFLSALFLMKQTLGIMIATKGKIDDLNIYAGKAEKFGVGQSWAIVVAVYLAWQLEASSTAWIVLWCVASYPGVIFSILLLNSQTMKKRRETAQFTEVNQSRRASGTHQDQELQPLAESLMAPGSTGPGSAAGSYQPLVTAERSYQPKVTFLRASGGVTRLVSRPKSEQVWSLSEVPDDNRNTRLSLPQLPLKPKRVSDKNHRAAPAATPDSSLDASPAPARTRFVDFTNLDTSETKFEKELRPRIDPHFEPTPFHGIIATLQSDDGIGDLMSAKGPDDDDVGGCTTGPVVPVFPEGTSAPPLPPAAAQAPAKRKSKAGIDLAASLLASDGTGPGSTATSYQPPVSLFRDSGGNTRRLSVELPVWSIWKETDSIRRPRRKSEELPVWSISEETDSIRKHRLSLRSRSQDSLRSSLRESDDTPISRKSPPMA